MAVLSGARDVRVMCVCVAISCFVTAVCARAAAECDGLRLSFPGRESNMRFLLFIMASRLDCAKSAMESNNDLNRMLSWALAVWSISGMRLNLLALVGSTWGRMVEKAAARWVRVAVGVVPEFPIGNATNSTRL